MTSSLEFLLGLLDATYPAHVAGEDFEGPHAERLGVWQRLGFLDAVPGANSVPSCPHCFEGTPYRIAEGYVCNVCRSEVDAASLSLWRFDLKSLLRFVASSLGLAGTVEQVTDELWQLGALRAGSESTECFFYRGGPCPEAALRRLSTYRRTLVFHAKPDRP